MAGTRGVRDVKGVVATAEVRAGSVVVVVSVKVAALALYLEGTVAVWVVRAAKKEAVRDQVPRVA